MVVYEINSTCVKSVKKIPYPVLFVIFRKKQDYFMKDLGWGWPRKERQQQHLHENARQFSSFRKKVSDSYFWETNSKHSLTYTDNKGKIWSGTGKQLYLKKQEQQKNNNKNALVKKLTSFIERVYCTHTFLISFVLVMTLKLVDF